MKKLSKQQKAYLKSWVTIPNTIILIGVISLLIYTFSYLFPCTDNAFVVNQVRPVAAQVRGFVTHTYVNNGDSVKKGQILFTVFKKPYQYEVLQLEADYEKAKSQLSALQMTYERDQKISDTRQKIYIKQAQDDKKYRLGYRIRAVSKITLQHSEQETKAALDEWQAAQKQLKIDQHQIEAQKKEIKSLAAKLNLAKVNLALTDVRAAGNGVVQNLFLTLGAPVNINEPLFSLVYTDEVYIQANFNETDLRNVHKGSKVLIFPRMYLGRKMFHGVVDSDYWSANRQALDQRTQLQNVTNENQWILIPQRLPVMIKVTDVNPKYPLRLGTSAYVYIKTG